MRPSAKPRGNTAPRRAGLEGSVRPVPGSNPPRAEAGRVLLFAVNGADVAHLLATGEVIPDPHATNSAAGGARAAAWGADKAAAASGAGSNGGGDGDGGAEPWQQRLWVEEVVAYSEKHLLVCCAEPPGEGAAPPTLRCHECGRRRDATQATCATRSRAGCPLLSTSSRLPPAQLSAAPAAGDATRAAACCNIASAAACGLDPRSTDAVARAISCRCGKYPAGIPKQCACGNRTRRFAAS